MTVRDDLDSCRDQLLAVFEMSYSELLRATWPDWRSLT